MPEYVVELYVSAARSVGMREVAERARQAAARISVTTEGSSGGLPAFVHGQVQRRATSRRCQRSKVSGVTKKLVQTARGSERLNAARKRSARVSLGRED